MRSMVPALALGLLAAVPLVGQVAPDFTVTDVDGVSRHLQAMVEQGPVVLAFFPKAFTGGCTRELTAYRDRYADIEKHHGTVVAISADDAETSRKFRDSLKAPYPFVGDDKRELIAAYDVKMAVIGIARRVTFVVGPGRKVLFVQEGSEAVDPSAAVSACSLVSSEALRVIAGSPDAGR
jgi:thioredoxin-dependent peroxiredoxin